MNEYVQSVELCIGCRNARFDIIFNRSEYTRHGTSSLSAERIWKPGNGKNRCLFCALLVAAVACSDSASLSSADLRLRFCWSLRNLSRGVLHFYESTNNLNEIGIGLVDLYRGDSPRWPVPQLLNTTLLKSWLHLGGELDGAGGRSLRTSNLFKPHGFRLLDCVDRCIISQFDICQYLALSYVWGPPNPDILKTVTENLSLLSQKDSLTSKVIAGKRSPKIIRDAIELVPKLGFRYLWVDSLCIIQDCLVEQQRLIDGMDAVFESAYASIIVPGCQNSDCEIPGVSIERSKANEAIGNFVTGENRVYFATHLQGLEYHITNGSWQKRSWTLQEQLLSRRCLYLTDSEAFFYANKSWFRESMEPFEGSSRITGPFEAYQRTRTTCAAIYCSLVKDYTARELTYTSDILRAFSGIYSSLCYISRCTLSIETTNGMLENLLPKVLLWTCTPPEARIHRSRRRSDAPGEASSTWAWCSRIGKVEYSYDFSSMFSLAETFAFGPASTTPNPPWWAVYTDTETKDDEETDSLRQLLQYWPEWRAKDYSPGIKLKAGQLGFWAPCIHVAGDYNHFFGGHSKRRFRDSEGFLKGLPADFGPYGGIYFDDSSHDCPDEIVLLVCTASTEDYRLFETRFEAIVGLVVHTNNRVSTRLGLVELFYSEPYPDEEDATRRHRTWLEFVNSERTSLYWRYVVLQ